MIPEPPKPGSPDLGSSEVEIIPLFEETAAVEKREVEQGRVRVSVRVRDEERIIEEVLRHRTADIERVPVNRAVDEMPSSRTEGDVLIIPIVSEEVVVTKRYILKEEIRIHLREEQRRERIPVTLKSEEVEIERISTSDLSLNDTGGNHG
jgi:uncharacterized protein (TIGR02271 family)